MYTPVIYRYVFVMVSGKRVLISVSTFKWLVQDIMLSLVIIIKDIKKGWVIKHIERSIRCKN